MVLGSEPVNRQRFCPLRLAYGRSTSPKFASLKGEEMVACRSSVAPGSSAQGTRRQNGPSCFSLRERSECWGEYRRRRGGGVLTVNG